MGFQHDKTIGAEAWLTPPWIIEALGPFDLDPCAAPEPRPWPTAARHFTEKEDGLALPWEGRVWLNPPYGQKTGLWLARLAKHGRGTALVFARTDTAWFHEIAREASALLFIRGRLRFHLPDGATAKSSAGAPSLLIAFGEDDAERLFKSEIEGLFIPFLTLKQEQAETGC